MQSTLMMFGTPLPSPVKTYLTQDDVSIFKTYIIYFDALRNIEEEVKAILKGDKEWLGLHISLNGGLPHCIHNSMESALEQLCAESIYPRGNGAYILCSNSDYESVLKSWNKETRFIDVEIEKAVTFEPYLEYTKNIKEIGAVPVMIASPRSILAYGS